MAASALLETTVSIEKLMAATQKTKKHSTLKKAVFSAIRHGNLQGKKCF